MKILITDSYPLRPRELFIHDLICVKTKNQDYHVIKDRQGKMVNRFLTKEQIDNYIAEHFEELV